ncbi:MAG: phage portal protein [Negativicutes bacterium]|nr:phage portal protein [Negativicutes bacterium]
MFQFLKTLFNRPGPAQQTAIVTLPSGGPAFRSYGGIYFSDIYLAGVNAIAKAASKLTVQAVVDVEGNRSPGDAIINRVLGLRPTPYANAAEWLYRCAALYFARNDLWLWPEHNNGKLQAIWPVAPSSAEFLSDQNALYVRFLFANGNSSILPYSEMVHLKRMQIQSDLLSETNVSISPAIQLASDQTQGLIAGIGQIQSPRGLLSFTQTLRPEDLEAQRKKFTESLRANNGIASIDVKATFQELNIPAYTCNAPELQAIANKIYAFLGVNAKIVDGSYTAEEYSNFIESTIMPFAHSLELSLSKALFTDRELAFNNRIAVETAGRMAFASMTDKINAIENIMPLGVLNKNQALQILGLPQIEGPEGQKCLQSLNYVDQAIINSYQLTNKFKQPAGGPGEESEQ